jgi:hypothetical protein
MYIDVYLFAYIRIYVYLYIYMYICIKVCVYIRGREGGECEDHADVETKVSFYIYINVWIYM